jgi:hypothetical protein
LKFDELFCDIVREEIAAGGEGLADLDEDGA